MSFGRDFEIVNAAKMANAHDFIMKKTQNYNTIAGDRGGNLSGGERQKLAIGMAIIGNPKIIFLDEPTSQLDPVYKNEIESIIKNLSDNNVKIFMTSSLHLGPPNLTHNM